MKNKGRTIIGNQDEKAAVNKCKPLCKNRGGESYFNQKSVKNYSEYDLSLREKGVVFLVSIALTLVISFLFYNSIVAMVIFPIVYVIVGMRIKSHLLDKRNEQLRCEFKDCLYSFSSSFSTGRGLEEAIEEARESLVRIHHHCVLAKEFTDILQLCEYADGTALKLWDDLSKRVGMEEIQQFTDVLWACKRSGGNLAVAVDRSANILTEKILVEGEIHKLMSHKKYESHMILLMPVLLLGILRLSSPMYLSVMYYTTTGRIMMTTALVIIAASYMVLERMMKVPI